MRAHIEKPPQPPRDLAPEIPVEMEQVMLRALEKDPRARFPSAPEFRAALEASTAIASQPSSDSQTAEYPLPDESEPPPREAPQAEPTHVLEETADGSEDSTLEREALGFSAGHRTRSQENRPPGGERPPTAWQRWGGGLALGMLVIGLNVLLWGQPPSREPGAASAGTLAPQSEFWGPSAEGEEGSAPPPLASEVNSAGEASEERLIEMDPPIAQAPLRPSPRPDPAPTEEVRPKREQPEKATARATERRSGQPAPREAPAPEPVVGPWGERDWVIRRR
jgi:serine/threonine-protein kinase